MAKTKTLKDALVDELKDLYSAESQLVKALPKMKKKASNAKLQNAFGAHLEETQQHVERLEQIAEIMGVKLSGKTCKAMQGLIEEGKEILELESDNEAFIDALLVGSAQRVEHYEIAAYGTARAMAEELGEKKVATLLDKTLGEEADADEKLSAISIDEILPQAREHDDMKETSAPKADKKKPSDAARLFLVLLSVTFGLLSSSVTYAETPRQVQENEREAAAHEADNSGVNARDVDTNRKTADDQDLNSSETEVLARIRREIVANDSLSVNGKNVKIIVDNSVVTLRGPVNSKEEKNWIENATKRVTSNYTLDSQLEVAPS